MFLGTRSKCKEKFIKKYQKWKILGIDYPKEEGYEEGRKSGLIEGRKSGLRDGKKEEKIEIAKKNDKTKHGYRYNKFNYWIAKRKN